MSGSAHVTQLLGLSKLFSLKVDPIQVERVKVLRSKSEVTNVSTE